MADNKGQVLISTGIAGNCLTLYILNLSVVIRFDYEEPKIYALWTYFMIYRSVNIVVILPSQMITNYRPSGFVTSLSTVLHTDIFAIPSWPVSEILRWKNRCWISGPELAFLLVISGSVYSFVNVTEISPSTTKLLWLKSNSTHCRPEPTFCLERRGGGDCSALLQW
jgi:hypothetical protein